MMQESMANALHTKFYRYLNDFKTILGRNDHTVLGNIILRKREIVVTNAFGHNTKEKLLGPLYR